MLAGSPVKIVGEATTAATTLTLAKKHKPAFVLLDAAISGGDAFELARTRAKPLPATKFIFVTETDNPTYMARARAVGAANCLLMGGGRAQPPCRHGARVGPGELRRGRQVGRAPLKREVGVERLPDLGGHVGVGQVERDAQFTIELHRRAGKVL